MKIKKDKMPFHSLALQEKYNIENDNVVVVEKNTIILRITVTIIKIIVYTVLLSLAFVGLISIILPETREMLIYQANHLFDEFFRMISGG